MVVEGVVVVDDIEDEGFPVPLAHGLDVGPAELSADQIQVFGLKLHDCLFYMLRSPVQVCAERYSN